jgi:hypothetical protein
MIRSMEKESESGVYEVQHLEGVTREQTNHGSNI